ncbi:hypothetical protein DUU79_16460 [Salmonella enterica subsp. enterica serovar Goldcoast]|uniref:Uncharacterized protein n=1 Tax=Salmonella enterica TaxID=28901 RepID=A0A702RXZ8_SALER|nr:hypothetical protein [Salmonella enterica]EAP5794310.1 hypothetical protein [Salmonella enterica subsp. enterica serovar Goldcoast]EBH8223575.1 hypothetical protein [Salmonella enterica subsp. enterica serovar Agona str. SL483]EBK1290491.1 hypothetical protein [Salmonella enterica]EBU7604682.1 hypothetical protein [Salmonella enterica subsp. enterica serovar Goldcoast]
MCAFGNVLPGLTPGFFMPCVRQTGHPASGVNEDSYKFTVMMGILFGDGCAHDLVDSGHVCGGVYCGFSGADIGYPPGDSPPERTSEY